MITGLLDEQLRAAVLAVLHGLDRRSLPQRSLRDVVIVQMTVALELRLQSLTGVAAVGDEHLADPAAESFDHAVGLRTDHPQ